MWTRALDKPLLTTTALILSLGLVTLYSAGQTDVPSALEAVWRRQFVWLGIGTGAALAVYRISPRLLEWATPLIYGVAVVLLVLTLVIGTGAGTAAGSKSWLALGGVRIGQPAEVAKLATVLMLARHLAARRAVPESLSELIPAGVIVAVPAGLISLQPDLGSALVFVGIFFAALFWAGVRPSLLLLLASPLVSLLLAFSTVSWGAWLILLTVVILVVRPFVLEGLVVWLTNVAMGLAALELWRNLAPYQQNRLLSFLNPEIDPRATGWHIIQSKIAIGSGGLLGKGFAEGTQKRLAFLPAQHTDFVFSIVGEELGFLGILVCLALFAGLVLAVVRIAQRATDSYASLVAFGIVGMLLTHILVNVGMTVGVMPITGIPLPLFSYGGSFLVICLVAIGLVLRISSDAWRSGYARV